MNTNRETIYLVYAQSLSSNYINDLQNSKMDIIID